MSSILLKGFLTLYGPGDIIRRDQRLRSDLAANFHFVIASDEPHRSRTSEIRTGNENWRHIPRQNLSGKGDVDREILVD